MLFKYVSFFIFIVVSLSSCEHLNPENDENPFNLLHNDKQKDKLDIDVNDDQNPFNLFNNNKDNIILENDDIDDENPFKLTKKIERKNISKEDRQIDIFLHIHLVQIIWNKINSDKSILKLMESKKYPISVDFKYQLTEEMFDNMREYNNVSNEQFGIIINHHFMNYLEIVNKKVKMFGNDTIEARQAWYETKTLVVSLVACVVFSFLIMSKKKFVLLLVVAGFVHKGWEMYEDNEIKKRYLMSTEMSRKCFPVTNKSYWGVFRSWFKSDVTLQCLELERDVHTKSHHNANVFKIMSAIVSDCLFGVFNSIGKLVGVIYTDMSKYLPWGMAPFFTLFMMVMACVVVAVVIIKTCPLLFTRSPDQGCLADHACPSKIEGTRHRRAGSTCKHSIISKPSSFRKRVSGSICSK